MGATHKRPPGRAAAGGTEPGGGISGLSSPDLQYHGSKSQPLQGGAARIGLRGAGVPFAGQHDTGLPPAFLGLPWMRSDARRGQADRHVAPERDRRGAEMLLGWLKTAPCLKMRDCFVPGSLLKGLTDTSLKCDLRCSTLPLLKEMLQQQLQYPGIRCCWGGGFTCNVSEERRKQTCKAGSDLHVPSGLVFPLAAPRAPAGKGTEQITPREAIQFPSYHKFSCSQIILQAGSTFLRWKRVSPSFFFL